MVIVSFIAFELFYSATSPDFKLAMEKVDASKTDTNKTIDTINDQTEALSESADMKMRKNTSAPESLPETESANEETDNSTTSKLIEDETYYFDDAMFTINGIQLTVNSITLHREYKPEGYSLEVALFKGRGWNFNPPRLLIPYSPDALLSLPVPCVNHLTRHHITPDIAETLYNVVMSSFPPSFQ